MQDARRRRRRRREKRHRRTPSRVGIIGRPEARTPLSLSLTLYPSVVSFPPSHNAMEIFGGCMNLAGTMYHVSACEGYDDDNRGRGQNRNVSAVQATSVLATVCAHIYGLARVQRTCVRTHQSCKRTCTCMGGEEHVQIHGWRNSHGDPKRLSLRYSFSPICAEL